MSVAPATATPGLRTTRVLHPSEVVHDEVLHPGAVVWLAEPWLHDGELDRFDTAARTAAMARHPAGRARHLRAV
ncbi:hypothetical protein [Salsipaludibacter albus]|uniref:hypothetical protein n=1 Tax=Salsipaludibacter albus TaxID=2849650 RepID=UPI001EE4B00F|nr:hypothetical protein [Salsipaludibacter albus]MBY5162166.1 hypothetical protein [Salsipaludibacter albus]